MRSLAWSMVRHRFPAFAGTFVAIALGVAVVAGAATLYLSSQPKTPARYDASAVLVHSPSVGDDDNGRPEYRSWAAAEATGLAQRLAALPGVGAAVADPAFYVQRVVRGKATGDPDESLTAGHAWSSTALGGYRLSAGAPPARDGEVALAGVAPGARIDVLTAAGPAIWTVTGTVDGPGFYVADAVALARSPGVRVIGLVVSGDPAAVASAAQPVTDGRVLAGAERDTLEPDSVTRVRWIGAQLLIALVFLGTFVAVFVVASTCALSAAQRRREIGLLRATGATPGQVRRLMYAETLVVAVAAGLSGTVLGALTAPLLGPALIRSGLEPAAFTVTVQPAALAGAFLLGIVVALAGVWAAAHRSSRVPALDALREAALERRAMTPARWICGPVSAAAGIALLAALPAMPLDTQSTAALGAAMLLLVAAALLAPVVIVPLVRVVTWPWRTAATGMLVREGTVTAARRVASTAAPALLTVGFTVLLTGTVATISNVQDDADAAKVPAAMVAAPDGTPGLPAAVVDAQPGAAQLPTRVLITRNGTTKGYAAVGLPDVTGVVVREPLGRTVDLRWPDGTTATLNVTKVDARAAADVVLPLSQVRAHDPGAMAPAVLLDGPATPAPGLRVMTARDYVRIDLDSEDRLVRMFLLVLIGLAVGYTGLAVANTLLMATAARRGEFAALRLAGAGTGQVLRVAAAEALLAVAVGAGLGAAVAAIALTGVGRAVEEELAMDVPIVVPWPAAVVVVTACAAVAVLATAAPVLRDRARVA